MLLRRRPGRLLAAGLALAAAGCAPDAPSDREILEQAERLPQPRPGRYSSTTRLAAFELPRASPQEADRLRTRMGGLEPQRNEFCLTPEQAREGFAEMLKRSQQGNCRFDRFGADERQLSAEMRCEGPGAGSSVIRMKGTAAAEASRMTLAVEQRAPAIPGGELRMELEISNRRIGDC